MKGKFTGHRQKWLILKFNGSDSEININTPKPEFLEWKLMDLKFILKSVVEFKRDVYIKVLDEVRKIISS